MNSAPASLESVTESHQIILARMAEVEEQLNRLCRTPVVSKESPTKFSPFATLISAGYADSEKIAIAIFKQMIPAFKKPGSNHLAVLGPTIRLLAVRDSRIDWIFFSPNATDTFSKSVSRNLASILFEFLRNGFPTLVSVVPDFPEDCKALFVSLRDAPSKRIRLNSSARLWRDHMPREPIVYYMEDVTYYLSVRMRIDFETEIDTATVVRIIEAIMIGHIAHFPLAVRDLKRMDCTDFHNYKDIFFAVTEMVLDNPFVKERVSRFTVVIPDMSKDILACLK